MAAPASRVRERAARRGGEGPGVAAPRCSGHGRGEGIDADPAVPSLCRDVVDPVVSGVTHWCGVLSGKALVGSGREQQDHHKGKRPAAHVPKRPVFRPDRATIPTRHDSRPGLESGRRDLSRCAGCAVDTDRGRVHRSGTRRSRRCGSSDSCARTPTRDWRAGCRRLLQRWRRSHRRWAGSSGRRRPSLW